MLPALASIAALGIAAAAVYKLRTLQAGESDPYTFENAVEEVSKAFAGPADAKGSSNLAAFLMMIRACEGTDSENGYRMLFGKALFSDFADHPRRAIPFTQKGVTLYTTAAGAYQIMAISSTPNGFTKINTWDRIRKKIGLPDFSPSSQDRAAIELIDECGALLDVYGGRVESAISKCRRVWASLPGAGYGQPERALSYCLQRYAAAGGALA